ncbi:hypothetical protein [Curtobacterium sp. VKM Ac-1376]|uniref:hypothetical protein n=1 Tax=Curtobacterium sp. VKM Ac-1376 TaxID=123312 RepID=UPI00188D5B50|nr:hypothetical protein [Curtobacterium sp. VKM Ac-1376]MBF4614164.1 hypothetical protein [Curtobacterium sp. VKM Ac-1376]
MFKIGWQVFRERAPELVGPQYRRRVVVVGAVVAVVAFVGLQGLALLVDDGSVPLAVWLIASVLFAAGIGCFGACFVPIGPKGWGVPPIPGIGWRTQEAVARYYRRNPPPLAPEHRDAVLDRVPETRDLIVRAAFRGYLLLGGWALALLATITINVATVSAGEPLVGLSAFWLLVPISGAASGIGGLRTLGRQEQLRVEAEALPPMPPPVPPRGRPGTRRGSKLALPEE